jgi:cytochrome c55X
MSWRLIFLGMLLAVGADAAGLDDERRGELDHLLRHDCGSCHGLSMQGGLGPALTPARMQERSDAYLRAAIRDGIPGTAMPPWGPLLSDADIAYLAATLREKQP